MDQTVVFTRGLSGSGKSTWAKEWVDESPRHRSRVNMDSIRSMLGLPFSKQNERLALQVQDDAFLSALRCGRDVVVDNVHAHSAWAKRLALLAWEAGFRPVYRIADFSHIPPSVCIDRDARRTVGHVGADVIRQQERQFQSPRARWTVDELTAGLPDIKPLAVDESLPWCIVSDIDGTLADHAGVRNPYDGARCGEDRVHADVAGLVQVLKESMGAMSIFMFSGRDEQYRPETEAWLRYWGIPFDGLFMRAAGDTRRDSIVKVELVEQHIRGQHNVWLWLDDRDRVVNVIRQFGIRVLQVASGQF